VPCLGGFNSPGTWYKSDPSAIAGSLMCATYNNNADIEWTRNFRGVHRRRPGPGPGKPVPVVVDLRLIAAP
jgi:hypothetical protein